jgi:hypothetical protein
VDQTSEMQAGSDPEGGRHDQHQWAKTENAGSSTGSHTTILPRQAADVVTPRMDPQLRESEYDTRDAYRVSCTGAGRSGPWSGDRAVHGKARMPLPSPLLEPSADGFGDLRSVSFLLLSASVSQTRRVRQDRGERGG